MAQDNILIEYLTGVRKAYKRRNHQSKIRLYLKNINVILRISHMKIA